MTLGTSESIARLRATGRRHESSPETSVDEFPGNENICSKEKLASQAVEPGSPSHARIRGGLDERGVFRHIGLVLVLSGLAVILLHLLVLLNVVGGSTGLDRQFVGRFLDGVINDLNADAGGQHDCIDRDIVYKMRPTFIDPKCSVRTNLERKGDVTISSKKGKQIITSTFYMAGLTLEAQTAASATEYFKDDRTLKCNIRDFPLEVTLSIGDRGKMELIKVDAATKAAQAVLPVCEGKWMSHTEIAEKIKSIMHLNIAAYVEKLLTPIFKDTLTLKLGKVSFFKD